MVEEVKDASHWWDRLETLVQYSRIFEDLESDEPGHGYPSMQDLMVMYKKGDSRTTTGFDEADVRLGDWWREAVHRVLSFRYVFLTEDKQLLGLCPEETQSEDQVYILQGGLTPFILRPISQDSCEKTYQLVGKAYVHGYMHGEAMERESEFEEVTLV